MLVGSLTMMRSEKACSQRAWRIIGSGSCQPITWANTGPGEASTMAPKVFSMSGPAAEIRPGLVVTPASRPHDRASRISLGLELSRKRSMVRRTPL